MSGQRTSAQSDNGVLIAGGGLVGLTAARVRLQIDVDFLAAGECLLLRPDHIVAWRGTGPGAAAQVQAALLAG